MADFNGLEGPGLENGASEGATIKVVSVIQVQSIVLRTNWWNFFNLNCS